MEAPFDATKSSSDMLNFSGSASDMLAAMAAAGIVLPEAEAAAKQVAAAVSLWGLNPNATHTKGNHGLT